ncbi:MAG: hypothetical protein LBH89_02995 [Lactococcus lactis]|jgi:hypothetical protein|nr:hypothetical protein [Lactococcus lactis]
MAQYEMSIRYAGDANQNGRMPIKDLAPALLAVSGALQEIQRIKEEKFKIEKILQKLQKEN